MEGSNQTIGVACLRLILRPVARFCLRHSIKLQELNECCKAALVGEAKRELSLSGAAVSASKLSIMTGVHRQDINRLSGNAPQEKVSENLTSRILGHWQSNKRFQTPGGKAKTLTVEGRDSEFWQLVTSVSADLNPYTVLYELERIGAVKRTRDGLKLASRVYIPRGNVEKGFSLLQGDTNDLISAVEENVFASENVPNLHIKTEYDNIVPSAVPEIRTWLIKEGSAFHQRARSFLSRFDRDLNPALKSEAAPAVRVALGAFSRVECKLNAKSERGKNVPDKK